ncbi:Fic family protein [Marivita sp. S6314]|nr:Fic family protein [Marivita sp. S6314]
MGNKRVPGRYVRQTTGYKAYMPQTLPLAGIVRSNRLDNTLSKADRALGRLDGAIDALFNADLFIMMYLRKEATLSSQIEGTQASLNDVLQAEADIKNPDRPDDVGETLNYVRAFHHGLERLETLPLSLRLLRELHEILMRDVRGQERTPGAFRTTQNWIGPSGVSLENASYVPPPSHELTRYLGNLEDYIRAEDDLPFLMKVGIAHAQFETLHPFLDGNGRLGRLLITFMLCERQILTKPVLYLSHFFKQNRDEYYRRLQATRDDDDWEGWLEFFLLAVATVSNEATETLRAVSALRENHRQSLIDAAPKGAGNALRLHEHLFNKPFIDVEGAAKITGTTVQGASTIVDRMCALDILTEITGRKRDRVFSYSSYLELFAD